MTKLTHNQLNSELRDWDDSQLWARDDYDSDEYWHTGIHGMNKVKGFTAEQINNAVRVINRKFKPCASPYALQNMKVDQNGVVNFMLQGSWHKGQPSEAKMVARDFLLELFKQNPDGQTLSTSGEVQYNGLGDFLVNFKYPA